MNRWMNGWLVGWDGQMCEWMDKWWGEVIADLMLPRLAEQGVN